jgi:hypothetical protein
MLARLAGVHSRFFTAFGLGAFAAVILAHVPLVGGFLAFCAMGLGALTGLLRELERSVDRLGDDGDDEGRRGKR